MVKLPKFSEMEDPVLLSMVFSEDLEAGTHRMFPSLCWTKSASRITWKTALMIPFFPHACPRMGF
jgi:hypothetical protein